MPVYATRKIRNAAAALMLLSGCSHVGQLWFVDLDGTAIVSALFGMFYLLIGLGLAGQSRFTLWIAMVVPAVGAAGSTLRLQPGTVDPLLAWHILADILVILCCAFILFRTRHAEMD